MKTNHLALLFFLLLWPLARVNAQMKPVDLGLSVKWASCNLGASKPHEFGAYYAWAEVEPKTEYTWETNRYCYYEDNGSKKTAKVSKYCTNSSWGNADEKMCLDAMDDAAQVATKGQWRMPTKEELNELKNDCEWTWTKQKGMYGYEVTSKKTKNSIFLPAAGYMQGAYHIRFGVMGFYWTSSLDSSKLASYLGFSEEHINYPKNEFRGAFRELGFCIRPVQP